MAAETSRSSTSSADSYIGSLISLTSKSEIRYEGILYNINTEESSIGLRNVRSFGSEGRKKDGPQIMPSDKVYEYILFRGSDIKDLQVKTSPPVQPTQPVNNDPAIIQSHYPLSAPPSSTLPPPPASAIGNSIPDHHNPQVGPGGPTFQGGLPLYHPDGSMGSAWGPSPSPPPNLNNSSGLPMPMYWPGYYAPPNGIPQQSLFRPTPMQYPGFSPSLPSGPHNLPEYSSPFLPTSSTGSANLASTTSLLGSTMPSSSLPPVPPLVLTNEPLPSFMQTKPPNSVGPTAPPLSAIPDGAVSNKSNVGSGANLSFSNPISRTTSIPTESPTPTPSLITPGQLLQSGQAAAVAVSSQLSQGGGVHKDVGPTPSSQLSHGGVHKDVGPTPPSSQLSQGGVHKDHVGPTPSSQLSQGGGVHKDVGPTPSSEPSAPVSVSTEAQPPILPLPSQSRNAPKTNGAPYQNRNSYRGRERGRGYGGSRPVMKFTEEFDFNAMNEKFNKDEVWGTLGKTNKSSDEDELEYENDVALPKIDVKPVYSKDDFFDTLSCNSNDNQSNNGRTRFSEQMKLDTETFGEFSRYRGGRGGRGPYRGGRFRGSGYHGRGYGYVNRGRGGRIPTRDY